LLCLLRNARHYTEALEIDGSSPLIYTKRAAAYLAMKKQKEAIRDLGKALELDPKMVQAMLSRGKIHRMLGNFNSAEEDFKSVLSIKPGHKTATQVGSLP
jgi:DnaJ family protein C protein 3